jgi:hypothetical protein
MYFGSLNDQGLCPRYTAITTKHAERKVSLQSFEQEGVAADAWHAER